MHAGLSSHILTGSCPVYLLDVLNMILVSCPSISWSSWTWTILGMWLDVTIHISSVPEISVFDLNVDRPASKKQTHVSLLFVACVQFPRFLHALISSFLFICLFRSGPWGIFVHHDWLFECGGEGHDGHIKSRIRWSWMLSVEKRSNRCHEQEKSGKLEDKGAHWSPAHGEGSCCSKGRGNSSCSSKD